jgi:hypothetical protein
MVLHIDMLWFSIYWTGGHEGSAYFFFDYFLIPSVSYHFFCKQKKKKKKVCQSIRASWDQINLRQDYYRCHSTMVDDG